MRLLSVIAAMSVAFFVWMAPVPVEARGQDAPPARLPFPAGATQAYVDLARVASESADGQAANQQVQNLSAARISEIQARQTEIQANQTQLQQNAGVMSAEAQLNLQQQIERLGLEIQRMQQDAEAEIAQLQQTLQLEFQQKLIPAIDRVAQAKGLQFIFSAGDGGLIWANPALDISPDVVEELNRASGQ